MLEYEEMLAYIVSCKPSSLSKHMFDAVKIAHGMDEITDTFKVESLRNFPSHFLLRMYDDLILVSKVITRLSYSDVLKTMDFANKQSNTYANIVVNGLRIETSKEIHTKICDFVKTLNQSIDFDVIDSKTHYERLVTDLQFRNNNKTENK